MKTGSFSMRFLPMLLTLSILHLAFLLDSECRAAVRNEVRVPNIPGYVTLKCDFHMHTVFSDGLVWPSVRTEEAWGEGLDSFAITDHIEAHSFKNDIRTNHNRPYEIAKVRAEALNLRIIKGAEITRPMPPGHLCAIFLEDANALDIKDWNDGVKAAIDQNAFVYWCHPGENRIPGKSIYYPSIWHPQHTKLLRKGWLHGIEVVNADNYYPEAHKWALEKRLTILGNSDAHSSTNFIYNLNAAEHRPMTLVFAKEKTKEAVKEALFARRTAVYWKNTLIGEEKYLRPLFNNSLEMVSPDITVTDTGRAYVQIHNKSEIDFELVAAGAQRDVLFPAEITLSAGKTVLFRIIGKSGYLSGRKSLRIPYKVKNLLIAPGQVLGVELVVNANFVATARARGKTRQKTR